MQWGAIGKVMVGYSLWTLHPALPPAPYLGTVTSIKVIAWALLLSAVELGAVSGRCQEDMETGEEREIESYSLFTHSF